MVPEDRTDDPMMSARLFATTHWSVVLRDLLRAECKATGKLPLFEHLKAVQTEAGQDRPQERLAADLKLTEAALKSALFRLRGRYREILRDEVAQTVSDPRDVDDEIRHLLKVVSDC
jgi:hypothetical protein